MGQSPQELTPVGPAPAQGRWSPLRDGRFRRFWAGGTISMTCYWMIEASCAWEMRVLSGADPLLVSLVTSTLQFTVMLAVMPAGVIADIVDRRRLIVASHAWLGIVVAMVCALLAAGWLTPGRLLAFLPAIALAQAIRMPVIGSSLVDTVERGALPAAVALNALGQNAARIVGPAAAGLLLGVGGASLGLAVAVAGLLLAGAALASVPFERRRPHVPLTARSFLEDARAERAFLASTRWKRNLLLRAGGFFACASAIPALLPVVFGSGTVYGAMLALYGAGAVAGLLVIGRPRSDHASERRALVAQSMHGAGLVLLGTAGDGVGAAAALLVCGAAWLALSNSLMTAAQLQLPAESRARGLSVVYAVGMAGLAAGGPVWGWVARQFGTGAGFVAAGACSLLLVGLTFRREFTLGGSRRGPV
ncbi:MAG: MFS transporter [Steroidobacteraceae bacterium]|jgi:MFS family permease|nr:MFS transporter [Steroidobacteraceae bacterium]